MQPQPPTPPSTAPSSSQMSTPPLLISTIIYILFNIGVLPAIGMVFLNDSGDHAAYIVGLFILGAALLATIIQVTVACVSVRRYVRTNGLAKFVLISHLLLGITLLLILACAGTFAFTTSQAHPLPSGEIDPATTPLFQLTGFAVSFAVLLIFTILPATALASIISAFSIVAKPPTTPIHTPFAQP